jgi:hypothetical protein
MLRTVANVGMIFSFAVAILIAAHSVSRRLAFAIFVGTQNLHAGLARAFTVGLRGAFLASMAIMLVAAGLSVGRGRGRRGRRRDLPPGAPPLRSTRSTE